MSSGWGKLGRVAYMCAPDTTFTCIETQYSPNVSFPSQVKASITQNLAITECPECATLWFFVEFC